MLHSRRSFLACAGGLTAISQLRGQTAQSIQTPVLNIGYEDTGNRQGFLVGGRRVAQERDFVRQRAGALRVGQERFEVKFVQPEVRDENCP